MSKEAFLEQLERLLFDIPKEEKEEALRYYQDYFEDASDMDEDKLVEELGTPEKVARQIKVNLYNKAANEAGVYTETGYSNAFFDDDKEEINLVKSEQGHYNGQQQYDDQQQYDNQQYNNQQYNNQQYSNATYGRRQNRSSNDILLIILLILTCPIWGSVGFGIIAGMAATVFGLVVGFGGAFVGLIAGGCVAVGAGIVQLFVNPLAGILLIGCGFILISLGLCFFSLTALIVTKLIPAIVKGVKYIWRRLFGRREMA